MELSPSLQTAINKYLAGEASAEEEQLVNSWYYSFDDREVVIAEEVRKLREKVGGRIWRRLTVTINEAEEAAVVQKQKTIIGRRPLMAAASLALLLLAGRYLFLSFHQTKQAPPIGLAPLNDVAPGGNKAILTLTNGSSIVLDSAHNGLLARQGATRISKLNGGKLVYTVLSGDSKVPEPLGYNTITTPRGGQFQITLPDGTNVWLNAATSLRYPTRFEGGARTVQLTGEAYFEVAKNQRQPFIVAMPDRRNGDSLHVEVLGTNFNVNGYEDEDDIKTTLVEGAVKVLRRGNSCLLAAGQQALTESNGTLKINRHADVDEALAWKNGLFQYNSTNLQVIMRQIARWYDVQVIYFGKASEEFFSGSVPRTENVSQILKMLALTNTVKFTVEGKNIRVERVEEK